MAMHDRVRIMVGKMLLELMAGPSTHQQLMDASGFVSSTVHEWIRDWRCEEVRAIRICGYEPIKNGQVVRPIYELNPEGLPDVKRPRAYKDPNRAGRYRMRNRLRKLGTDPATIEQLVNVAYPRVSQEQQNKTRKANKALKVSKAEAAQTTEP